MDDGLFDDFTRRVWYAGTIVCGLLTVWYAYLTFWKG